MDAHFIYRPSNILAKFINDMQIGRIAKTVEERIKMQNLFRILYINYISIENPETKQKPLQRWEGLG